MTKETITLNIEYLIHYKTLKDRENALKEIVSNIALYNISCSSYSVKRLEHTIPKGPQECDSQTKQQHLLKD